MPRIRFKLWYQGIAPGMVITCDDPKQVAALTKKTVIDEPKGLFHQIAEIVPDSTPTTAELEIAAATKGVADPPPPAKASVRTTAAPVK